MSIERIFKGIRSSTIRKELLDRYGLIIYPSGFYRLARELNFPKGERKKSAKGLAWTYYTEEEKNKIIELVKSKFRIE